MHGDSIIDRWVLRVEKLETPSAMFFTQKASVSPDKKRFILYEEKYYPGNDSIYTKLMLFNAARKRIWVKLQIGERKISYGLTRIYDSLVVFVTTNKDNSHPAVSIIKNKKMWNLIKQNEWTKVVDYEISLNYKYMVLYTKNPHNSRQWDYIFFIDLTTIHTWQYLFPICFSCKRGNITLKVDDTGQVEVIYKKEHRLFSEDGQLIDVYIKTE